MSKPPSLRNHPSVRKRATIQGEEESSPERDERSSRDERTGRDKSSQSKSSKTPTSKKDDTPQNKSSLKLNLQNVQSVTSIRGVPTDRTDRSKIISEYQDKIKSYLEFQVADVMEWECPQTTVQDWDNVPETSVQITLYLQKHAEAIVLYLKHLLELESTETLRTYCIERMTVSLLLSLVVCGVFNRMSFLCRMAILNSTIMRKKRTWSFLRGSTNNRTSSRG